MRLFRKRVKGKTVRNHCSTPPGHVAYTVITPKKKKLQNLAQPRCNAWLHVCMILESFIFCMKFRPVKGVKLNVLDRD